MYIIPRCNKYNPTSVEQCVISLNISAIIRIALGRHRLIKLIIVQFILLQLSGHSIFLHTNYLTGLVVALKWMRLLSEDGKQPLC